MYAYVDDPNGWIDVFGLEKSYKTHDIGKHSDLSPQKNRKKGHKNIREDNFIQSHHFIAQEWVKQNLPSHSKINKHSPTILIPSKSGMSHANISKSQGARRRSGELASNTLKQEFNTAFREMVDAGVPEAKVKKLASKAYKYFNELGHI